MRIMSYRINSSRVPIYLSNSPAQMMSQLRSVSRPAVVIDSKISDLYEDLVTDISSIESSVVEVYQASEENKNLKKVEEILTFFLGRNIRRDSVLFSIGGGITGDVSGFVAAVFLRGIDYVHIPTTLLAMVDSSIGGKVGVNHDLGKNMIGSFYQPACIIMNTSFLETLPKAELVCGLGEIVKYAVLRGERFFDFLERNCVKLLNRDPISLERIIRMSVEAKKYYVERDTREAGIRAHLNLGHTVGHAIEAATRFSKFKHGEAVLIGLVAEAHIAMHMKLLQPTNFERVLKMVRQIAPQREEKVGLEDVLVHLKYDKKVRSGKVRFVLPTGIGRVVIRDDVAIKSIVDSMKFVASVGLVALS